ncbi:MAG: valine--tRNA ligase [Candidatus Komeilibacteria bacterium]|nr:valine--tRNA ligase [Candidatus Komeilibacteria bacterium]
MSNSRISSKKELPKAYIASEVEDELYVRWEKSGAFAPHGTGEPYAIMMPPPNVTGILHIGHVLEQALMDTKIRFERMRGKRALLLPGTDHAAVATQARVEKDLIAAGHANPRKEFGRDKLLEIIRKYAEKNKSTMLSQIRMLGTSCDWSRLAYTLDEKRSAAVVTMFKKMYDDGFIYRGYRVVNWSVVGQSTCSDDELVHIERKATVYTFKYSKDFPIPIATTRPETKLGDTAVAVHPDDKRYKQYVGNTFTVDVGAAKPLLLKVIADKAVDPKFGTGAVGVTPAHSMIDFELQEKHGLELIPVIGKDGKMTAEAGTAYAGLIAVEAREKFVAWLKKEKLLIKEEEISQNVATSDRFGDVIEALPMRQWFVAVQKEIPGRGKTLKDLMREAGEKIEIQPERYKKLYYQWIDNLRDWCISRQVWWGHRIPVWYRETNSKFQIPNSNADLYIDSNPPENNGWVQDPDTLDTWFSSGLWTFSTLGWPEKTDDLKTFYPTAWMTMGYEILFFWMARMILMSEYALKEIPFKQVYIHGILRDSEGKKFSKSLRNTIDPLVLTKKYGTDALRLALLAGNTPGNDSSFNEERVQHYQHFVNKLWNISRYVLMQIPDFKIVLKAPKPSTIADGWVLQQWSKTLAYVTNKLERAEFSQAATMLYTFTWEDLADWYIEVAKIESRQIIQEKKAKDAILQYILPQLLKALHPFIPFASEAIWGSLSSGELLISEQWPVAGKVGDVKGHDTFEEIKKKTTAIRQMRSEMKIPQHQKIDVKTGLPFVQYKAVVESLTNSTMTITDDVMPVVEAVSTLTDSKRKELEVYIKSIESKLANKEFTKKAPKSVVDAEKKKLADARAKLGR